jgi:dUTPase
VKQSDRIAQMVVNKLPEVELVPDYEDNYSRNSNRQGGFGSTGV